MNKTYLVELLKKLSTKQIRELGEFVQSPFFNKNEGVLKFFNYLKVQHPEFKEENITKELVFRKLFHPAEYNDGFMRMLTFKLAALTEEYLAYANFKSKPHEETKSLVDILLDLDIENEAKKQIAGVEKKLASSKTHNSSYFKNRYDIEKFKTVLYARTYRAVTVKDKPDDSLLEESDNLTAFFLISILQRYRYLLNKSHSVNSSYNPEFLPHILQFLGGEGKRYLDILLVSLLCKQISILNDNTREDLIDELINDLTNNDLPIDNEERREGLTVTANVCIEKIYEGKQVFYEKMFTIDKYIVAKNLYNRVRGRYFENEMFHNIVTTGLKLNEIAWTRNFIDKYYKKLSPGQQTNIYNYSQAKLYFKEKNFEKALQCIARVAYSDLHMKINVRITAITILYELQKIEDVLTQIENFRKYIQNDKLLSKVHKKITGNFIKFISSLCKAKFSSGADLDELKKKITAVDQVSHRAWLLNKVDELAALRK